MFFSLASLLAAVVVVYADDQETEVARRALTTANNAFSVDLYQALRNNSGNIVVSPLSAAALLSLVYLGAGGETAAQLKAALHLPDDNEQVSRGFGSLLDSLQNSGNTTSKIANKVYLHQDFNLKDTFKQTAVNSFRSEAEEVNFAQNAETARLAINEWVEQHTDRKIKDLFPQGSLDVSTVMVLVNAIYFKGAWKNAFSEYLTQAGPFYLPNNAQTTVQFMHETARFGYGSLQSLNTKVLELPYVGNEFKFLVLLPDAVDGLGALEAGLGQINFANISSELSHGQVRVTLPKFRIENKFELHNTLPQLGVTKMFERGANLTGITDDPVLVSKVLQKAFIEVTENGTIAAAATGLTFVRYSAVRENAVEFVVNRPFLYVLLHSNGNVLFLGRCSYPEL